MVTVKSIKDTLFPPCSEKDWIKSQKHMLDAGMIMLAWQMCMRVKDHGKYWTHVGILKAYNDARFNLLHDMTEISERYFVYIPKEKRLYIYEKCDGLIIDRTGTDKLVVENLKVLNDSKKDCNKT